MSKPKFTPGPWRSVVGVGGGKEIEATREITGDKYNFAKVLSDNKEADAALISAAPEMYVELENAITRIELYLEYERADKDSEYAHRENLGEGYVSQYTKNIEAELASMKKVLAKARGES